MCTGLMLAISAMSFDISAMQGPAGNMHFNANRTDYQRNEAEITQLNRLLNVLRDKNENARSEAEINVLRRLVADRLALIPDIPANYELLQQLTDLDYALENMRHAGTAPAQPDANPKPQKRMPIPPEPVKPPVNQPAANNKSEMSDGTKFFICAGIAVLAYCAYKGRDTLIAMKNRFFAMIFGKSKEEKDAANSIDAKKVDTKKADEPKPVEKRIPVVPVKVKREIIV